MKTRCAFLLVLGLILIPSTATFAYCPDSSQITYHSGTWRTKDHSWTTYNTANDYPSPSDKYEIKFLEANILTGNGKDMPGSASPHARCIYKVSNYGIIILRQRDWSSSYHWTQIDNQYKAWKYIPHEGDPNFGEWRCSESLGKCSFSG